MLNIFKESPPANFKISDKAEIEKQYRYWRMRILYATTIGYVIFYCVRANISMAMPLIERDLGIRKAQLGLFLTLHGLLYGVSKFVNGILGDRANPRFFMAAGLLLSALMNFFFGMSSIALLFGIFWLVNGWFQGMGFPPCSKSITNWFAPKERGMKYAIWNTSHSLGAAAVFILNSFLVGYNWRLCFFVPAIIAVLGAIFIIERLRDTPESLGLPPVTEGLKEEIKEDDKELEKNKIDADNLDFKTFLFKHVFGNPAIWIMGFATFCIYTIRYAIFYWGPTFLYEMKGVNIKQAGWLTAGYEIAAVAGMLSGGFLMDKIFKGKGARTCLFYMLMCSFSIFLFWKLPIRSITFNALIMCAMGFFIYGPQCLTGVVVANLATKRASATAIGLTGLFSYLSTVLSGWGLGALVDRSGWSVAFLFLLFVSIIAMVPFAVLWNINPNPVKE